MSKKIIYGDSSRAALIKGVNTVADVVKVTIGPKGKNVVIEKEYGIPQIINDGVSIAREVELEDPVENAGVKLIQEACSRANESAGDGSTTSCVLVQAMLNEGMKEVSKGRNVVEIKKGMQQAAKLVTTELDSMAIQVDTASAIKQVASISAGNDDEVGELLAQAVEKVGKDGIITVSESKTFETTLEVTEGMQFDRGYISPHFATDVERGEASYENSYVLCVNKRIGSMKELLPILEKVAKAGKPLLIIAEDVEGEALATLVMNHIKGLIKVVAVKAPDFGINRKDKLEDITILTGGKLAVDELGQNLELFSLGDLGVASKVIVTKDRTTIIVDEVTPELEEHVRVLQAKIMVADNELEKNKLKERLAKLVGGVAVIKVGALTEVEMLEKKLRIEDALNATRAAVKEGVVAGGGVALLQVLRNLGATIPTTDDFGVGANVILRSLTAPIKQIMENAGLNGEVIIAEIRRWWENKEYANYGYNVLDGNYVDMIEAGIIDPVKVTKSALLNAASVASMLLTTEAAIVRTPEKEKMNLQGLLR